MIGQPFEVSTQAASWLFTEESLSLCRKQAVKERNGKRARKFASGFDQRSTSTGSTTVKPSFPESDEDNLLPPFDIFEPRSNRTGLTADEQDVMIRFHSHQMSMVIGPNAVLPELMRSASVLATAVMLFRRFYLSNCVLDFQPRRVAIAACLLASKIEEEKVPIGALEHATEIIFQRVKGVQLCREELGSLSARDIEIAEKQLMEGVNYQFICHHPHATIQSLVSEIVHSDFFLDDHHEHPHPTDATSSYRPKNSFDLRDQRRVELENKAMMVAQSALLFSDVPFLFSPAQIAFASLSMALACCDMCASGTTTSLLAGSIHPTLHKYIRSKFAGKPESKVVEFEEEVVAITHMVVRSPVMDLNMLSMWAGAQRREEVVAHQAEELRIVFRKVSHLRSPIAAKLSPKPQQSFRKRKAEMPPMTQLGRSSFVSPSPVSNSKIPKVTPNRVSSASA
uniref:Cyclin-like domain-containing protein n=1 Tax=Grammatophora oceanica TaxID=210454 RepID=A0A7S1VMQ6_9STRA|mmetsp:Transcript_50852/g.76029  ORF Transcript_50852/g.76029 Transcript_50852/m.76029 type:complete len:453 (+) Transcript_50852:47-1405(+)